MLDRQQMRQLKIEPPDQAVYKEVLGNWDALAKPLDGMGEFEELFARIGAIRRDPALDISRKAVVVMCADNGIVEEKISQSGQDVTAKVAAAMGRGTSSVCRMAKAAGVEVIPVDIGINEEGSPEGVLPCKVRRGTRNFIKERAMTEQETLAAIEIGMELAKRLAHEGYKLLATGEMGIGNTTTSSAVAAALLSCDPKEITGKGAGLSDTALLRKIAVVEEGIQMHELYQADAFDVLCAVGGLDIAGLSGVFGKLLRPLPLVLGLADDGQGQPRRQCLFVQVKIAEDILHHALGIARVVDREAAGIAVQPVDLPPQDAAAGRVERHGPDVHSVVAQQRLQSGLQFICGLVGECDGQNRPRRGGPERAQALGLLLHGGIARFEVVLEICNVRLRNILRNFVGVGAFAEGDEIGDAVDENGRLAAARTGQQQQRPLRCKNALALHLVQVLKARSDHSAARG